MTILNQYVLVKKRTLVVLAVLAVGGLVAAKCCKKAIVRHAMHKACHMHHGMVEDLAQNPAEPMAEGAQCCGGAKGT